MPTIGPSAVAVWLHAALRLVAFFGPLAALWTGCLATAAPQTDGIPLISRRRSALHAPPAAPSGIPARLLPPPKASEAARKRRKAHDLAWIRMRPPLAPAIRTRHLGNATRFSPLPHSMSIDRAFAGRLRANGATERVCGRGQRERRGAEGAEWQGTGGRLSEKKKQERDRKGEEGKRERWGKGEKGEKGRGGREEEREGRRGERRKRGGEGSGWGVRGARV